MDSYVAEVETGAVHGFCYITQNVREQWLLSIINQFSHCQLICRTQPGSDATSDYCFKSLPIISRAETVQALAAYMYSNLATITDRYTMCKVLSDMPCTRKVRSTYIVCAHELTTLVTCCYTDRLLDIITPSIFTDETQAIPGKGAGGSAWSCRLQPVNITWTDFIWFSFELFLPAHASTLLSSAECVGIRWHNQVRVICILTQQIAWCNGL